MTDRRLLADPRSAVSLLVHSKGSVTGRRLSQLQAEPTQPLPRHQVGTPASGNGDKVFCQTWRAALGEHNVRYVPTAGDKGAQARRRPLGTLPSGFLSVDSLSYSADKGPFRKSTQC